ncbi:MAG: glycosyltransferase family 4 protein [Propionibacteriaceae bacterium]|nr:glycosyltransferase family 4 protein [Propionibacteriaceae bacterium]
MEREPDGTIHTPNPAGKYSHFAQYLRIADEVIVVARVAESTSKSERTPETLVSGPGVKIQAVPKYRGLAALLRTLPKLILFFQRLQLAGGIAIGRLPEVLSLLLYVAARVRNTPYLAYVVADPDAIGDALANSLRFPPIKRLLPWLVQKMINKSRATIYVTEHWLQDKFPPPIGRPTLARSNVVLNEEDFRDGGNLEVTGEIRLISVATMGSALKGHDMLLKVVDQLQERIQLPVFLHFVGDGPHRPSLEEAAVELSVSDRVHFHGNIATRERLHDLLDSSHIFVSGSRMEGLPRAVIEAMARSMPVVSTRAGGTEELIGPENLVELDDHEAFTARCCDLIESSDLRRSIGLQNYQRARQIQASTAPSRVNEFLDKLL